MEELFPKLKSWMIREVIPRYINMVGKGEVIADEAARNISNIQTVRLSETSKILIEIVHKVAGNPRKVLTNFR